MIGACVFLDLLVSTLCAITTLRALDFLDVVFVFPEPVFGPLFYEMW